jgi:hypothetical protein
MPHDMQMAAAKMTAKRSLSIGVFSFGVTENEQGLQNIMGSVRMNSVHRFWSCISTTPLL